MSIEQALAYSMPSDQRIETLHRKYAKTEADFRLIFTHSTIVKEIAMQLLDAKQALQLDRELVRVGCMLHDIGVYDVIVDGAYVQAVRHGVIGEEILKKEGFPEAIWRIASHHTGTGLTAEDVAAQELPIPPADYLAETDEERLVMYADKFHTKGIPRPFFNSFEECRESLGRFGEDKVEKFDALAEQFGKPDLAPLIDTYGHPIKER